MQRSLQSAMGLCAFLVAGAVWAAPAPPSSWGVSVQFRLVGVSVPSVLPAKVTARDIAALGSDQAQTLSVISVTTSPGSKAKAGTTDSRRRLAELTAQETESDQSRTAVECMAAVLRDKYTIVLSYSWEFGPLQAAGSGTRTGSALLLRDSQERLQLWDQEPVVRPLAAGDGKTALFLVISATMLTHGGTPLRPMEQPRPQPAANPLPVAPAGATP